MKIQPPASPIRAFLACVFFFVSVGRIQSETIFSDDFEIGNLGASWSTSGTHDGRAVVNGSYSPAAGQYHLVLDDSVNDANLSVAEATLMLDLSFKKVVVLTFDAKSIGNEPHTPPAGNFVGIREYDGVAISADGGVTWRAVQSLANLGGSWQTFSLSLDSAVDALGESFGPGFRIRFSDYDNASTPVDGIAIDNVKVDALLDQQVLIDLPSPLLEGSGTCTAYLFLNVPPTAPVTFALSAAPQGQLALPASVTVPSGQNFVTFDINVLDNNIVDLTRSVTISASASGFSCTPASMAILDDDIPALLLNVPARLNEGETPTNNATLSVDQAPAVALTVALSATPEAEVTLPASVTIPAGQTSATFTMRAYNDSRIDGDFPVTVMATGPSGATTTAATLAVDNEPRTLSMPAGYTLTEGGSGSLTISIPGTLLQNLQINLASSNVAGVSVPSTLVIPAGSTSATVTATALDNTLKDGTRTATITATAPTFTSADSTVTVRDNDIASYKFGTLGAMLTTSSPVNITVSAVDLEGNVISGASAIVTLAVVLPDNSIQPLTPASISISGATGWTGNVTLPLIPDAPLRLRVTDAAGNVGLSTAFDTLRVLMLTTADLQWDAARTRFYATVPATATDSYANKMITIDPVTAQVTGSLVLNQDPGQIVAAGDSLYVALNANGTISRVNQESLSVTSTFAVGTSANYGTLYAEDMCTVAGQPDLLVVSQMRKSVSPRHNGVAVYDHGVARSAKTQDHTGSNIIEPSADPTLFFGYNTETTEYGFRQLKLDATGMTQVQVNTSLMSGFTLDIRSEGNRVYATGGTVVDGLNMRRLGAFSTSGLVCPDPATNRVYFLESTSRYSSTYDRIGAYDPVSFNAVRPLALPGAYGAQSRGFIRWGKNGLAFRTASSVVLISASQLIPSDPPANLAVSVQASPNPATVGQPLSYVITVVNQGPNAAANTRVSATLSDSQTLVSAVASSGSTSVSGSVITVSPVSLPSGGTMTVTVNTLPQSAGSLSLTASALSDAVDPDAANNTGFKLVSVGFQAAMDVVNQLRLTANNLIYDTTRGLLWATIPATVDAPLGRSLVSINPSTGLISDPLPLNATPIAKSMAISANGRYLYVGLSDSPEVARFDLNTTPVTLLRIPLGLSQWGDANYAQDIEVLDGDGVSFMIAGRNDHAAAVYDGAIRRPNQTGIYTVDRIGRTGTPGVFVGYNNYTSGFGLSRLAVDSSGVMVSSSVSNVISGYYTDFQSAGDLVLASTGVLASSTNLALKSQLGVSGRPCVDYDNNRAYMVNGNLLRGFDTATGSVVCSLALPVTSTGDWAQDCVRWGLDGCAILGGDGKIYITRLSSAISPTRDSDHNGLSDAWESRWFGQLGVAPNGDSDGDGLPNALEFLFGTAPTQTEICPLQVSQLTQSGDRYFCFVFPCRNDIPASDYGFETSTDLIHWTSVPDVIRTVQSSSTVEGAPIDNVECIFAAPSPDKGFARMKWLHP